MTSPFARDGLPAMVLFFVVPFLALALSTVGRPLDLIDAESDVRARTEGWRPQATTAAAEAGVPVDLLLALVATESSGRPTARSSAGAVGLTQLMPPTAAGEAVRLGIPGAGNLDLQDPELNLRLGASYFADQLRAFDGDEALALAAYHSGPGVPAGWRRDSPGSPGSELVARNATPRTRAYVERVLRRREWFREPPQKR
jgi:soluble lytic murein transglycosylase-like protein